MPSRSGIELLVTRRRALQLASAPALAALSARVAYADTYPDRPITCVLPLPPGSPLDTIGRIVSERLRKDLGYPFVLENVAGAVSNIGTARVAHAAPDGYTLLLTVNSPVAINAFLYKDMPFDAEKDLAPVILTSFSPVALAVHNSFPAHTMQEFIAYAKAHPGEVACGNSGVGSTGQLCAAYLTSLTGINLNIIPYKGTPETTADLIGGHIQSAFTALGLVTEQAKAGVLRILAVTSDDRISLAPDVPTIRETVPEFVNAPAAWHAIFAPSHTPASVIDTINREANLALQDPETIALLTRSFLTPAGGTPEVLAKRTKLEHDVAGTLIKKLGILPQ